MQGRGETLGDAAFRAAQSGDLGEVLALLGQGANPDVPDRHDFHRPGPRRTIRPR